MNTTTRYILVVSISINSMALIAGAAPQRETGPHDEMIPVPRIHASSPVKPIVFESRDGFLLAQVNIDSSGANILGDAANEPSIAVDPTAPNRIVIGWRQFDTVSSNFRQAGYAYTNDGGRTWTFPGVIEPGIFRSDPVLETDAEGNFYYNSLTVQGGDFWCDIFKSTDGGQTWDNGTFAFGGDKQWFVIDKTSSIGQGNIYMTWSGGGCCGNDRFTRSTDGNNSYENPIAMPEQAWWGQLDVDNEGTLYVFGRDPGINVFHMNRSLNARNAGQIPVFDLSVPVDLGGDTAGFVDGSPNPGGLLGQMNIVVDKSGGPTEGNVYVLATVDPPGSDPVDVMFARSTDGGNTWSNPVRINDDPAGENNWQWFGTLSVAPNGRIDVIWNDTRNTGQANMSELYYAFSTDGGITWSANQQLSDAFNSHLGWPNQNKMGDYYDMKSDLLGADLAWSATFNGEQDVYFLRIGEYDCNANGVADSIDIADLTSADCNENGIPDECEIAAGAAADDNGDGIIDDCQVCLGDLDGDGDTDQSDLGVLLAAYLINAQGDIDGDGDTDQADLGLLLSDFGCGE